MRQFISMTHIYLNISIIIINLIHLFNIDYFFLCIYLFTFSKYLEDKSLYIYFFLIKKILIFDLYIIF